MTAEMFNAMVWKMRKYRKISSRIEVENLIYDLSQAVRKIGRIELANQLCDLVDEIENIDTDELVKIGTFNKSEK